MKLIWIDHFDEELHEQLFDLYKGEWWTKGRSKQDVISAFENSDIVIGCLSDDGKLLACARILSDFTFKAFIFDVIIQIDVRGKGLGAAIIDKIRTHDRLQNVKSFELYCPDQLVPFYQKLGFDESSSHLLKWMR